MGRNAKPTVYQFRPQPTGNLHQDIANRQIVDLIHNIRNSYGPAVLYGVAPKNTLTVVVPVTPTGFSVSVSLTRPGVWVLSASVALNIVGDPSQIFTLALRANQTVQALVAQVNMATDSQVTIHQAWQITAQGGENCSLLISKDGGAGTSNVNPLNSTLTATWQGTNQG